MDQMFEIPDSQTSELIMQEVSKMMKPEEISRARQSHAKPVAHVVYEELLRGRKKKRRSGFLTTIYLLVIFGVGIFLTLSERGDSVLFFDLVREQASGLWILFIILFLPFLKSLKKSFNSNEVQKAITAIQKSGSPRATSSLSFLGAIGSMTAAGADVGARMDADPSENLNGLIDEFLGAQPSTEQAKALESMYGKSIHQLIREEIEKGPGGRMKQFFIVTFIMFVVFNVGLVSMLADQNMLDRSWDYLLVPFGFVWGFFLLFWVIAFFWHRKSFQPKKKFTKRDVQMAVMILSLRSAWKKRRR